MRLAQPLSLACCAVLASAAAAQSFNYPDFSSIAGLALNGTAAQSGTALRLNPSSISARGSAWYAQPVGVGAGFDTTFTFQITLPNGGGADGMVFVIQNDPRTTTALGNHASALGYGVFVGGPAGVAIANSIAIEIDTYAAGSPWGDPNGNHISVHTNGTGDNNALESLSLGLATPTINMSDGQVHTLRVTYVPGTLQIYLDNLTSPLLSVPYSFATGGTWTAGGTVGGLNLIGGTSAYVGFTAACGGAWEAHDVLSWTWNSVGGAPLTYCTAGTSTNGCVPAIAANAQPSVAAANVCTIGIANVEGQKNGLLFYGVNNSGFTPVLWGSGSSSFLCVKPPTQRTANQSSGGTSGQCDGALSLDWNAFQANNPAALGNPWSAGAKVYVQGWYRDPAAVKTTNLSDALELTYVP